MPRGRIARQLPAAEIAAYYQEGATTTALAARYGTSPQSIARRLRSAGVEIRRRADWTGGRTAPPFDADRLRLLAGQGMSTAEIGQAMGRSAEWARRRMIDLGLARLPGKARPEKNAFWRGGRTVDRRGYVLVKAPGHPAATKGGYVREHRLVVERTLGRYLTRTEVVHHVDGDPGNNDPANLQLYATNGAHLRDELEGRRPDWTEDGLARIQAGVQHAAEIKRSSRQE